MTYLTLTPSVTLTPSANEPPTPVELRREARAHRAAPSLRRPGLRARFGRRLKARLRGAPMTAFRDEGPSGRFVLIRDRSGTCDPILILSASRDHGVPHDDLRIALELTPKAHLIQGTWRRRGPAVGFCPDNGRHVVLFELHQALADAGADYELVLLEPWAA